MKKRIVELIKSVLAGIVIALGGIVFLSCDNRYVGALLFSVGLISIVVFGWNLYTGKVGYLLENDKTFFLDTALSVIGNFIGCFIVGILKSPVGDVVAVAELKLAKTLPLVFFDAVLCGILIFISVEIYKKKNTFIGILFCIPTFILCGFEHSIADIFYFINSRSFSLSALVFILVAVVGNAVGGLLCPFCRKIIETLNKSNAS